MVPFSRGTYELIYSISDPFYTLKDGITVYYLQLKRIPKSPLNRHTQVNYFKESKKRSSKTVEHLLFDFFDFFFFLALHDCLEIFTLDSLIISLDVLHVSKRVDGQIVMVMHDFIVVERQ